MRISASKIRPGDKATVFAFPAGQFHTGRASDVTGTVKSVKRIELPYTRHEGLLITFDDGRQVEAIHYAVSTLLERPNNTD